MSGINAARLGLADIVPEPLPTLIRNQPQDDNGPVIADLNVLPVGHVPRLEQVAFIWLHTLRR